MNSTAASPLRIAVVGSGPAGFYAAEALLRRQPSALLDMFERLPTPYGLVRGGVAPDHPKIKQVCLVYDKIASSKGFAFFGNVEIGRDVTVEQLRAAYHVVVLAYGASADRRLGIAGEDLPGSHTATEFVGWYNGHPDYQDRVFDLGHDTAVVIGQGNVAADIARILATPVDALRATDITEAALSELARSRIRHVVVVGRRGPAQAKFTPTELRELGKIPHCACIVSTTDLTLNAQCEMELADPRGEDSRKNVDLFRNFSNQAAEPTGRTLTFRFHESPAHLFGEGRVAGIKLSRNQLSGAPFGQIAEVTGEAVDLACGIVFRSIGYTGKPIPGVPFDPRSGTIPNDKGRCLEHGNPIPGLYVCGWIKRGPTGIIGTNRADSVETVEAIVHDVPALAGGERDGARGLPGLLDRRITQIVDYDGWRRIDDAERARGKPLGKPREKFIRISEMLAAAQTAD